MTDAVRSALHETPGRNSGDDLAALHAREIDKLVAYLFSSDRVLGMSGAEAIAEQAFLELRATWPGMGGYPSHQVHLYATAQRIASTWQRRPQPEGSDPLKDSAPAYWDRADVTRLTVLQECLDRLPDVPRRVVLLREMCGFTGPQAAQIVSVPENGAENARADGLRALVPMIESGTSAGDARRGPLVPEDFGALSRVLQPGDGRVAAARSRFAETLSQPVRGGSPAGSPPGAGQRSSSPPDAPFGAPAGRPPMGQAGRTPPPGRTPQPPAVAPPAPPTAAFGAGLPAGADITRMLPSGQLSQGTPQPGMGQPGMGQPGMGQPGMGQPGMGQPGMGQQYAPPAPMGAMQQPLRPAPMPPQGLQYTPPPMAGNPMYAPPVSPQPGMGGFQQGALPGPVSGPSYASPGLPPPSSYDSGSLLGGPSSSLVSIGTPIFDSVSAWFSSGGANTWASLEDDAWREAGARAAASPSIAGNTESGLPRRRPGANTVPSATETLGRSLFAADPGRIDAGIVRSRLDGFQQGLLNARRMRDQSVAQEEFEEELEPEYQPSGSANGKSLFGGPEAGARPPRGAAAPRAVSPPRFEPFEAPANGTAGEGAVRVPPRRSLPGANGTSVNGTGSSLPRRPSGASAPAGPSSSAPPVSAPSARAARPATPPPLPQREAPAAAESGAGPVSGRRSSGLPSRQRPQRTRTAPPAPQPVPEPAGPSPEDTEGRPSEARGFGAFYRDYLPQLLALLMIEGARPATAAELAQDVMSAAYREWARIEKPREWTRQRVLAAWIDRREEEGEEED